MTREKASLIIFPAEDTQHAACPKDLLYCSHHSPHIPPVRGFAPSTPYGDTAGQDALYGAPVECSEDGWGQEGSPPSQEAQRLLCLLDFLPQCSQTR